MDRVSTILITGLTGCGKTKVIQNLLNALPLTARCAVCVHQHARAFGLETTFPIPDDFKLDDPRLALYFEVYDFGSGCICCSPDGDLTRALWKLSADRECGRCSATHLIIETTGIADPRPFSRLLSTNEDITRHFRLDSVAVVLKSSGEAVGNAESVRRIWNTQISNSDVAIFYEVKSIKDSLRKPAIDTERIRTSVVNSRLLFIESIGSASLPWTDIVVETQDGGRSGKACGACDDQDEWGSKIQLVSLSGHDQSFQTACVVESGGVILDRFTSWISELLDVGAAGAGGGTVLHVKGFVAVRWESDPDAAAAAELGHVSTANTWTRMMVVSAYAGGAVTLSQVGSARQRHVQLEEVDGAYEGALREPGTCKLFFLGSVGGACRSWMRGGVFELTESEMLVMAGAEQPGQLV